MESQYYIMIIITPLRFLVQQQIFSRCSGHHLQCHVLQSGRYGIIFIIILQCLVCVIIYQGRGISSRYPETERWIITVIKTIIHERSIILSMLICLHRKYPCGRHQRLGELN